MLELNYHEIFNITDYTIKTESPWENDCLYGNMATDSGSESQTTLPSFPESFPPKREKFLTTLVPVKNLELFDSFQNVCDNVFTTAKHMPVQYWSQQDVLDTVYSLSNRYPQIDPSKISGERFSNIDGLQLSRMTCEELTSIDETIGPLLYQEIELLNNFHKDFCEYTDNGELGDSYPYSYMSGHDMELDSASGLSEDSLTENIPDYPDIPQFVTEENENLSNSSMVPTMHCTNTTGNAKLPGYELITTPIPDKRGPGRPRRQHNSEGSDSGFEDLKPEKKARTRGRKPGQVSKGNHLWEFIRDLLKDPQYNPAVIQWEDEHEGVFRIKKSGEVSRLWGQKKNNTNMNYEKLSRAMRFCRCERYFGDLPKDGRFPKKLCFKFGERAQGWRPT